jgi:hypothetical protein
MAGRTLASVGRLSDVILVTPQDVIPVTRHEPGECPGHDNLMGSPKGEVTSCSLSPFSSPQPATRCRSRPVPLRFRSPAAVAARSSLPGTRTGDRSRWKETMTEPPPRYRHVGNRRADHPSATAGGRFLPFELTFERATEIGHTGSVVAQDAFWAPNRGTGGPLSPRTSAR